jgi:hypothetical protein
VDLQFVDRVIRTTLILAAFLFPFLIVYAGVSFALGVLFGAVWGCLNLLAIRVIVVSLLTPHGRNRILAAVVLFVKIPVLYGAGYLLLTWDYLSAPGLVWGFSGILLVVVFKALGRAYLGLDGKVKTGEKSA